MTACNEASIKELISQAAIFAHCIKYKFNISLLLSIGHTPQSGGFHWASLCQV